MQKKKKKKKGIKQVNLTSARGKVKVHVPLELKSTHGFTSYSSDIFHLSTT